MPRPPTAGLACLAAVALTACSGLRPIELRQVGASSQCHTPGKWPRAELLKDAAAVRAWQKERAVTLVQDPRDVPHVVVELGTRHSSGYGVALEPAAETRGEQLTVYIVQRAPGPNDISAQVITTPCALGELPEDDYEHVDVRSQGGFLWATSRSDVQPAGVANP